MTRPVTGRAQHDEGPELDRPPASPARGRAQRPRRCPARPPRSPQGRLAPPAAGSRAPAAHLRAAACLALALLAAALPALAAKPVLRTNNPVTVTRALIRVHYDQTLSGSTAPASAFTVTVGGNSFTPINVFVDDNVVVNVSVGFTIAPDETVTIAYAQPSTGAAIINTSGEKADSFSETTATNDTTVNPWSTVAVSSADSPLAGNNVALRFTGQLAATTGANPVTPPPASAFTVTVDGTAQTPGGLTYVANFANSGKALVALQSLPTAIKSGQTVQVSYAPPLGTTAAVSKARLLDTTFKLVQRFTGQAVTNNAALVSNTSGAGATSSFASDHAQAFTTGSRATSLDEIGFDIDRAVGENLPTVTVTIRASDADGLPGESLGTLTNPSSWKTDASHTRFAAPASGIVLAARTTYFAVVDVTSPTTNAQAAAQFTTKTVDTEDAGATTGWSIADSALVRGRNVATWLATHTNADSRTISVHGAPVAPTLVSAAVNGTALTLTFNAELATGSAPTGSAFTVRSSSGTDHTGTGTVTINAADPKQVSVTLNSAVNHGDETLTVVYVKPGSSPLKDTGTGTGALAALEVANFSGQAVKNNTPPPALVSNTGQTASGFLGVGGSANWANALTFTTGGNATGYTLHSVDVTLATGTPLAATRVSIYETTGTPPAPTGSGLHVLNNPASLTASAVNTFTADAGATLAANTTYAVVVDRSSGSGTANIAKTTSNDEDSGAATGWSIGDKRHFRQGAGSWSEATDAEKPLVAIRGTAMALLPALTANPTTIGAGRDTDVTFSFANFTAGASLTLGVASGCTALSFPSANAAVTIASNGTASATRTLSAASVASATDCAITLSPAVAGATLPTITVKELPLVSNAGETKATGTLFVGWDGSKHLDRALAFTTGGNTAGYTLSAVDVKLASGTPSTNFRVSIYTTRSNPPIPETSLQVLNNPSPLVASATNTFTATPALSLDDNTTYAVVIEISTGTDSTDMDRTVSTGEDSGKASDWSIADNAATHDRAEGIWKVLLTDFNKPLIAIRGTAKTLVITPPNTQDPPRTGPSGGSEREPRDPVPLQLALWTDKPGYRAGETVRLYRSLEPHDDRGRYRALVYLERPGGEERRWLAPLSADGELHAEAVDARGVALDASRPRFLSATDRELAFEGEAPGPGLWQFVLELRPGSADEQAAEPDPPPGTRRAWAKFAVAERSQLLNRSGFDRELTRDATLRSEAIYFLGHQLFVRDGVTLTIEPGTLVKAWGHHAAIIVEPGGADRRRGHPRGPGGADLLLAGGLPGAGLLGRPAHPRPGPGDPPGGAGAGRAAPGAAGLRRHGRGRLQRRAALRARGVRRGRGRAGRRPGRDRPVRSRQRDRPGSRPGPPEPRRRLRLPRRRGRLRPLRRQRVGRGRTGLGPRLARGRRAPVRAARRRGRVRPRRRQRRGGPRPRAALAAGPVERHPGARGPLRPARARGGRDTPADRLRADGPEPAGDPFLQRRHRGPRPLRPALRRGRELGPRGAAVPQRLPPAAGRGAGRGGVRQRGPEAARRARLRQPRPAPEAVPGRHRAGRGGMLHRGLRHEGELARGMDRVRAGVRVRPAGAG